MRLFALPFTLAFFLVAVLVTGAICFARNNSEAGCVSFNEANKHMGTNQCVSGTVLRVENGGKGVTYLNFCKDKD